MYYTLESYELIMKLAGKDPEDDKQFDDFEDEIEDFLLDTYGVDDPHSFDKLIKDLMPYAMQNKSELSGEVRCGFADKEKGLWLCKTANKEK